MPEPPPPPQLPVEPDRDEPSGRHGARLLIALLVAQLVLAGVLLWAAATGFSFFRGLFSTAVSFAL